MKYLGLIEMRVTELLQAYAVLQQEKVRRQRGHTDKDDKYFESLQNLLAIGPSQEPSHIPMRIEPPSFPDDQTDDGQSESINDKPLGIEEFKQKVEMTEKEKAKKRRK